MTSPRWLVISAWTGSRWRASPAVVRSRWPPRISSPAGERCRPHRRGWRADGPGRASGPAGADPVLRLARQERAGAQRGPAHGDEVVAGQPGTAGAFPAPRAGRRPEAKHVGQRIEFEAVADALRQGTRGAVQELALRRPPWPFPLSEIKTPVHLWHGARDTNAPIAIARRLARTGGRFPARQRLVGPRCRPRPQRRDHVRDRFLREIERSGSPWCRWSC